VELSVETPKQLSAGRCCRGSTDGVNPIFWGTPFNVKTAHTFKIRQPHVITVAGKTFYDIGHAPAGHSNWRNSPQDYAVWEIHPVMALQVDQ